MTAAHPWVAGLEKLAQGARPARPAPRRTEKVYPRPHALSSFSASSDWDRINPWCWQHRPTGKMLVCARGRWFFRGVEFLSRFAAMAAVDA